MKDGVGGDAIRELRRKYKTKAFEARYDVVFLIVNHNGFAQQAAERLRWPSPMASEAPWYVHNVPTVAISMHLPNHLTRLLCFAGEVLMCYFCLPASSAKKG